MGRQTRTTALENGGKGTGKTWHHARRTPQLSEIFFLNQINWNMMIRFSSVILFLAVTLSTARAQMPVTELPEFDITAATLKGQLHYFASDFMRGRDTGSPEMNIAAEYLAAHLKAYGYEYAPGLDSYFQPVNFKQTAPPQEASLTINKKDYVHKEDFLLLSGKANRFKNAQAVFAGHGWVDTESGHDDYADLDVEGKIVFVQGGPPDANSPQAIFEAMSRKQQLASERGAVALIEIYNVPNLPWNFFLRYFGRESLGLDMGDDMGGDGSLAYGWMQPDTESSVMKDMQDGKRTKASLMTSGFSETPLPSQNVIGVLPGTDPELKDEYVMLTAHYDHVGVGAAGSNATMPNDSIFNGARDNGMGSIALLNAAKALGEMPTKRTIVVMWVTGEEKGLLGSRYYAERPLIPLEKTIFNLNTDGAGYNSTEHVSIFGFGRTGTDEKVVAALTAAGLKVFPDPAPEQNLFDRSDNVSFAIKGVPAMTFSPGLISFDERINKYYHQVTDNPDSIDYDYMLKYVQSYAFLARLIANDAERPTWVDGDKYYDAGQELYNKK